MREALNDNPMVQAAVIGILILLAAVFFLTQMGKGGSGSAPAQTASGTVTAPNGATADITASQTDSGAAVATATVQSPTTASAASTPASLPTMPFVARPGVPQRLVSDHESGKTVVVYIYEKKGIEDARVRRAVEGLRSDGKVAVYTVNAKNISRYSGITQGVGVSQVPALVVLSSQNVGGNPKATVSYGFRGNGSVEQAVRDAVYKGQTLGYDPG